MTLATTAMSKEARRGIVGEGTAMARPLPHMIGP
jgi:hypothetical protein